MLMCRFQHCLYIQNCPASIFHSPPIAHAGSTEVCANVRVYVCTCVRVCACMYDYHIAVSFKTLAPFESVCACVRMCVRTMHAQLS